MVLLYVPVTSFDNSKNGLVVCRDKYHCHIRMLHLTEPIVITTAKPVYPVHRQMKTRPGEVLIDCLDSIEDTKGNNGDRGTS